MLNLLHNNPIISYLFSSESERRLSHVQNIIDQTAKRIDQLFHSSFLNKIQYFLNIGEIGNLKNLRGKFQVEVKYLKQSIESKHSSSSKCSPLRSAAGKVATVVKNHPIKTALAAVVITGFIFSRYPKQILPINLCDIASKICEGNFGIPRGSMPQLDGKVKEEFLEKYSDKITPMCVNASSLVPTQSELNASKVVGMALNQDFDPCVEGILTANGSNGYYIIDGHHRAIACRLRGGFMNIFNLNMSAREALDITLNFPGSNKAGL